MAGQKTKSGKSCRILIADDHTMVREGLRKLLEAEPDFVVVGEAASGKEAIAASGLLSPDILLLDLAMPGKNGLTVLEELKDAANAPRVIVLTASATAEENVRAIRLGARGIILKEAASRALMDAIRSVMVGQYWIHPERMADLIEALKGKPDAPPAAAQQDFGLTPRERDIIDLVVDGYSNPDIAQKCSISEQTVKHHVSNIFDKLGVYNRVELALFAVHHDLARRPS